VIWAERNPPLEPSTTIPDFVVTTLEGERCEYADLWQRRQIVLALCEAEPDARWRELAQALEQARDRFVALETELVLTRDRVGAFAPPAVIVADRWGEVTHATRPLPAHAAPPDVGAVLSWVEATLHRCPECEGEAW
jgi:hypothetical protein